MGLEKTIEDLLNKADSAITNKDMSTALEILEQAKTLSKSDEDYYQIGRRYWKTGNNPQGIEMYSEALRINQYNDELWTDIGQMLLNSTKDEGAELYEKSLEASKKAIKINPQNSRAWHNIGRAYLHLNKNEAKINAFLKATDIELDNYLYWGDLGIAYFLLDHDKSICALKKSIEIRPYSEITRYALHINYVKTGQILEAYSNLDEGIKLCSTKELLLCAKAELMIMEGKTDDAYNVLESITAPSLKLLAHSKISFHTNKTISSIDFALAAISAAKGVEELKDYSAIINHIAEASIQENIYKHIALEGFKDLIDILKENVKSKTSDNLIYVLCPILDFTQNNTEYIKFSQELFREILNKNPEALVSADYNSRNLIETISINSLSENLYFIKTTRANDDLGKKKLVEEYKKTKFVNSVHPKTTQALFIEQNYLVEKRISAPSLAELEEDAELNELYSEIQKSLETMSEIHEVKGIKKISSNTFEAKYYDELEDKTNTIIIPKYDFLEELDRRLINRLGGNPQELIIEYKKIYDTIQFEEKIIHSDSYKENWLRGGYLIDWERPHIGDPLIDVVQLINDVEFQDINKKEMLEYYHTLTNYKEDLEKKYEFISIHNALCQFGAKIHQEKIEEAQQYLEQTLQVTNKYPALQNKVVQYLKSANVIR